MIPRALDVGDQRGGVSCSPLNRPVCLRCQKPTDTESDSWCREHLTELRRDPEPREAA